MNTTEAFNELRRIEDDVSDCLYVDPRRIRQIANVLAEALNQHESIAQPVQPPLWNCFHCAESFSDKSSAALHFGRYELHSPACQIDVAEYRKMEAQMERYNEDDSDMHRQLYAQEAWHQLALRREEESGYAKGLEALAQPVQPADK